MNFLKKINYGPKNFLALLFILLLISLITYWSSDYICFWCNNAKEIAQIAIKKGNPNECSKIVVYDLFKDVTPGIIAQCYEIVALDNKDRSVCDTIISEDFRKLCIKAYDTSGVDLNTCNINSNREDRAICYTNLVRKGYNSNLCDSIPDATDDLKDRCYAGAFDKISDTSFCKTKLQADEYKINCYVSVAYNSNDNYVCKTVTNEALRNKCYKAVAYDARKIEICNEISGKNSATDIYSCKSEIEVLLKKYPGLN